MQTNEPSIHDKLREWREIPKREVFADDLADHKDPHQREIGMIILQRIADGQRLRFRYAGGSEPGFTRSVLPTWLFFPDYSEHWYLFNLDDPGELPDASYLPLYFIGWCETRRAPRVFCLDRMQMV